MNPSPGAAARFAPIRLPSGRLSRLVVACELVAALGLFAAVADSDLDMVGQAGRDFAVAILACACVAAVLAADRRPGRGGLVLAGALALFIGVWAMAAGGVMGVTGILVEGPNVKTVLGCLGFAAGMVLVVAGAIWLLQALPKWWRLAGLPAAYVVLQFFVFPVSMAMLGTHLPRPGFTATPPQGAQRVNFPAGDGVALAGWYTPSMNGATVIVLAGAGSTKADTAAQAAVLTRNGFGVLALDARGTGESGGHPHLWGWGGEKDVVAAIDYLVSLPGVDPARIAAMGESMGGEVAITAAAVDTRIRAVVAEGATARTCSDLTFLGNDLEGTIHRADSCLGYALTTATSAATEPKALHDEFQALGSRPVLLIAADLPEEHAATEAWRSVSPSTIQLWEPASTGHTAGLATHPAEWEQRVVSFLNGALAAA